MSEGSVSLAASVPLAKSQDYPKVELGADQSVSTERSKAQVQESEPLVTKEDLVEASNIVADVVNAVADTSLSFSVDSELSRMVVSVRLVGSDEIVRQFPPEEFLTVAKFIAAQNMDELDEDFLKGILFDKHG